MTIPPGPRSDDLPLPSLALVVLDGWGLAPAGPGNAVSLARTPVFDELWNSYSHTQLDACGASVGLPAGQMGNSEVGHLNLGAGTVVRQDLARIDGAIADRTFFANEALRRASESARPPGTLHLIGLVSEGGVHSSLDHLRACIELAVHERVPRLVVHAFTDGRDTLPTSSPGYLAQLEHWLERAGKSGTDASVGSVSGRYWAMDRDQRWDRTKRAYEVLAHGDGLHAESAEAAVSQAYERDETDEFIQPTLIGPAERAAGGADRSKACLRPGDSVILFNFRPDRMRQLTMALGEADFDAFERGGDPGLEITTMTRYREGWGYQVAFEPSNPTMTIARRWRCEAIVSFMWRRRRSTPMSPTSSTGAMRSRRKARSAASCPRPATSPPTTTSRR
jgi:2,3-bisphosphoglycerate-independent phosphoglycerate mutase